MRIGSVRISRFAVAVIAVAALTVQGAIATNTPLTADLSYDRIDTLHAQRTVNGGAADRSYDMLDALHAQRTFAGTVDKSYDMLDALHAQPVFPGTADNSYDILDALHAHRTFSP